MAGAGIALLGRDFNGMGVHWEVWGWGIVTGVGWGDVLMSGFWVYPCKEGVHGSSQCLAD
jgi:hypothetical protein